MLYRYWSSENLRLEWDAATAWKSEMFSRKPKNGNKKVNVFCSNIAADVWGFFWVVALRWVITGVAVKSQVAHAATNVNAINFGMLFVFFATMAATDSSSQSSFSFLPTEMQLNDVVCRWIMMSSPGAMLKNGMLLRLSPTMQIFKQSFRNKLSVPKHSYTWHMTLSLSVQWTCSCCCKQEAKGRLIVENRTKSSDIKTRDYFAWTTNEVELCSLWARTVMLVENLLALGFIAKQILWHMSAVWGALWKSCTHRWNKLTDDMWALICFG